MANAEFERFIESLENLHRLNEEVAREAVGDVREALAKTCAAGEAPDGTPWKPLADGAGDPLTGAASALKAEQKGNRVLVRVGPPWVFHHYGAGGSSKTKAARSARARAAKAKARAAESGEKVKASKFHAPRRQMIPDPGDPIPDGVRDACAAAAARVFRRTMGGS